MNDYRPLLEEMAETADQTLLRPPGEIRAAGDRRTRRHRSILVGAAAAAVVAAVAGGVAANNRSAPDPSDRPRPPGALPWPGFERPTSPPTPPDGVQTQRVLPNHSGITGLAFSNGRYLAVGTRDIDGGNRELPVAWTSTDGVEWTAIAPWPEPYGLAGPVAGTRSGFVMLMTGKGSRGGHLVPPYVLHSPDGVTWSTTSLPVPASWLPDVHPLYVLQTQHAMVLVAGHMAAPGQFIWVSRDEGATWTPQAANYFDPTPGGDEVCAVREDGDQLTLAVADPYFPTSRSVVADGYRNTEWQSRDGSHWTRVSTEPANRRLSGRFCYLHDWKASRWVSAPHGVISVTGNGGVTFWPTKGAGR